MSFTPYSVRRPGVSRFLDVRGLRYHVLQWGEPALVASDRPPLVMLHGWMDVGASFQFVVDAFSADRFVLALDWRGFGLTDSTGTDTYWFPDYLADLDTVLDALVPDQAVDLLGHSMGGNVAMAYAGVRAQRIRRLINLEGFGMPNSSPSHAPRRIAHWLDEIKLPTRLRRYDSVQAVSDRLRETNPLLPADRAAWLAQHWSRQADDGQWEILGDPVHKRTGPLPYRTDEVLEYWKRIEAPVMWVEGDQTEIGKLWGNRYPREEFEANIAWVPRLERHVLSPAGHMVHHDQPHDLARRVEDFLAR